MMGRYLGHLVKNVYFWLLVVVLITTGAYLCWSVRDSIKANTAYHHSIAQAAVTNSASLVSKFIAEYNHRVQLFADQHTDLIRAFAKNPEDEQANEKLKQLIEDNFPGYFAHTVANRAGIPVVEDFDGLVAEFCRVDMKSFAENQTYQPYIHPNYEGYHFDTMVNYGDDEGILFISFRADVLGDFVRATQTPGHQVMLVYPALKQLIEVIAAGARNKITRNDYRLSEEEKSRILEQAPVADTRWEAVDLIMPGTFENYQRKLYFQAAIIFTVLVLISLVFVWRATRERVMRADNEKQTQELINVISHELRTPATSIHAAMELISRATAGTYNAELKQLLEVVSDNSLRLLSLVSDFLDIQKHEFGKLKLEMTSCELFPIIEKSIQSKKSYADRLGVSFSLNPKSVKDVKVNCDPQRIEQVMANLLSNAAKYGAEKDAIEISVTQSGSGMVRVSVTDHGTGIAPQIKHKVFEKFVMAKSIKPNDSIRSSGLGLSIAKAIIQEHGGKIDFDSDQNGTVFYFELPVVS